MLHGAAVMAGGKSASKKRFGRGQAPEAAAAASTEAPRML